MLHGYYSWFLALQLTYQANKLKIHEKDLEHSKICYQEYIFKNLLNCYYFQKTLTDLFKKKPTLYGYSYHLGHYIFCRNDNYLTLQKKGPRSRSMLYYPYFEKLMRIMIVCSL